MSQTYYSFYPEESVRGECSTSVNKLRLLKAYLCFNHQESLREECSSASDKLVMSQTYSSFYPEESVRGECSTSVNKLRLLKAYLRFNHQESLREECSSTSDKLRLSKKYLGLIVRTILKKGIVRTILNDCRQGMKGCHQVVNLFTSCCINVVANFKCLCTYVPIYSKGYFYKKKIMTKNQLANLWLPNLTLCRTMILIYMYSFCNNSC